MRDKERPDEKLKYLYFGNGHPKKKALLFGRSLSMERFHPQGTTLVWPRGTWWRFCSDFRLPGFPEQGDLTKQQKGWHERVDRLGRRTHAFPS